MVWRKLREPAIFGAGVLLGFLMLALPTPLPQRLGLGFFTFCLALVAALLRVGADGVPIEVYLARRVRFALTGRRFVYFVRRPAPPAPDRPRPEPETPEPEPVRSADRDAEPAPAGGRLRLARPDEYRWDLALAVIGLMAFWVYLWGIAGGGAREVSGLLERLFGR